MKYKYTATIVEDQRGVIHIRISGEGKRNVGPQIGGQVKIVGILHEDDEKVLKREAIIAAGETDTSVWGDDKQGGFFTAWFYMTKDMKQIKIRYVDTPAADESHVLDMINDIDPNKLKTRARRYLLTLKKQHKIQDGPKLP